MNKEEKKYITSDVSKILSISPFRIRNIYRKLHIDRRNHKVKGNHFFILESDLIIIKAYLRSEYKGFDKEQIKTIELLFHEGSYKGRVYKLAKDMGMATTMLYRAFNNLERYGKIYANNKSIEEIQ